MISRPLSLFLHLYDHPEVRLYIWIGARFSRSRERQASPLVGVLNEIRIWEPDREAMPEHCRVRSRVLLIRTEKRILIPHRSVVPIASHTTVRYCESTILVCASLRKTQWSTG